MKLLLVIALTATLAGCFGKGPQAPQTTQQQNSAAPSCGISTTPTAPCKE
jgi:hypothetical protein